jgi:hypothetical protein
MTFSETLKAFHTGEGRSRRWAANQLCVSIRTYDGWCDGRRCIFENAFRKLIKFIGEANDTDEHQHRN